MFEHLAHLKPAATIGFASHWDWWSLIVVDCGAQGHFNLAVGSRPSLEGAPILSVERGVDTIEGGYYDGAEFWKWLQSRPEFAALIQPPRKTAPCS